MKAIVIVLVIVIAGYVALYYTPAGRRGRSRMEQNVKTVPSRSRYHDQPTERLKAELEVKEQAVAMIQNALNSKPEVVAACGMTRTAVVPPDELRRMHEFEADIRELRAELAIRR
jgi:hypothetical protein